jgi:E3 ubiquitin-protein ligase MYLIP
LLQVCEHLNIGPEADYFGLKISRYSPTVDTIDSNAASVSDSEEEGCEEWANLRNPMAAQRPRLRLRVKFWVPPHRLLLPATKHQFYLNARRELLTGRMVVADWDVASRLVALIAQVNVLSDIYLARVR